MKASNPLQRPLTHRLLSTLAVAAYLLIVSGAALLLVGLDVEIHPILLGLMIFILAVGLFPIRNRIQDTIDAVHTWNPRRSAPQNSHTSGIHLSIDTDAQTTARNFQRMVAQSFSPSLMHLFVYDPTCNQYTAVPNTDERPSSDLRYPPQSPLVQYLHAKNKPFEISGVKSLPDELMDEHVRIALLGAVLLIPLPGQKDLVGWLALGPRKRLGGYNPQDLARLESLCGQAAVAIERSQVITNLERRVREMDVLTRIAQGVNITLEFDNILELIYAQTNLVIPAIDFRITLRNPIDGKFFHAFFLEDDERMAHNENINIPTRNGLEEIVIQNQQAIITPDYSAECRKYGVYPNSPGIYAWMGVPLNAGSETIGAISLGSRDPATIYVTRQSEILQAISDLAAGAIVKTQLLSESERRARQLAKLNEVGRSLTSTLELNPLLNRIMNSAVEILNCEAGSLIMIDENTRELVFKVTVGPTASDISDTRLPPGTGRVGQVAETGQPVILNNTEDLQNWIDEADQQTGFLTRDYLAVPMKVKETTIGVIEVINKLDGAPFTQDDLEVLSTFTSQAAISVENARLYTHTDEALSARLEEMSVMQRIDRELNASLDAERTMRITLDWSLSYTNTEAGLIGFIEKGENPELTRVQVISSSGFGDTYFNKPSKMKAADNEKSIDIIEIPAVISAIDDGQPTLSRRGNSQFPLLTGEEGIRGSLINLADTIFLQEKSRSQVVIPIRRKTDVIGLILLESQEKENFTEDAVTFLTRLSDHAAIAISNALLYADLQTANIAKSEFVSLVSHELKTPMTSIRGYTDLLAQESVGPVNEIQLNFLNTIRSNVNRMANLVSDLTDVSRIEAGRMRLEFGSVSLTNIIEEVSNSVQAQLADKEHTLKVDIPENLPNVWGDYNRIIQVMNNLLSNAIKYTPQHGKIRITCQVTENSWDTEGAPQVILVSVNDSGFGISSEDNSKIFHKFFRSGDQNVRDVPGTGLGLNITRHLVEMQGGQIWFDSEHGKGSTFYFTIPVSATD
jgi:signal transduction histidine kinase